MTHENEGFAFLSDRYTIKFHRTRIFNWVSDSTQILEFVYGKRYFQLEYLKYWPYANDGFAFISVRNTIQFTEQIYDTEIQNKIWKVNLYSQEKIQLEKTETAKSHN